MEQATLGERRAARTPTTEARTPTTEARTPTTEARTPTTEARTPTTGTASPFALGAIGLISVVALWQLGSMTGVINPRYVPSPLEIAIALGSLMMTPGLWYSLWSTVSVALLSLVVVVLIAIPTAMAIHRSHTVRESTWFVIEFLKPIPPVALIPLGLLLWGPTKTIELFLVVLASLWPLLTQLIYGMREVSGTALEVARVYRFSPWQRASRIVLPSILPFALTGLRISASIALVVAIVVEYIGGVPGLGQDLVLAQINGLLPTTYALIVMAGFLGLTLNGALAMLSKPLLFWHASEREKN